MASRDGINVTGLRRLKKLGDKSHQPRPTDFYFYGEPEFIATLSDVLARRGFDIRPTVPEYPGIVATIAMKTDGPTFTRTANWLASLAGDLGVEFDGWETELVTETH